MSRIKILTMLFITFLLGTGASVALYRDWVVSYHEQVLEPEMKQRLTTVHAAIDLFAYNRANKANQHVNNAAKLLAAFEDTDPVKRRNRVHDELNVLHQVNADLKTASLVVAVDMQGKAFVRADDPNWSAGWQNIRPVSMAVKGSTSHGFVTFQNRPFIFLAIPVMKQASPEPPPSVGTPASEDGNAPSSARKVKATTPSAQQCPTGKYYTCWRPCIKKNKHRKCIRYSKKKRCGCLVVPKNKRHKTSKLVPRVQPTASAQASNNQVTPAPQAATTATNNRAKQLGAIILGYLLDDRLALAIKASSNLEMAFVSAQGRVYGATLQGRMRESLTQAVQPSSMSAASSTATSSFARAGSVIHLHESSPYAVVRSPLHRMESAEILLLQPLHSIYDLFQNYVLWVGAIGGLSFLLALVLVFPGVSRTRRDVEAIEDLVLETYNTGNLRVQFNANAEGLVGSLGTSLNKLYSQLRGEKDEDDELKRSGDWDIEGLGVDERIISGTFPVPQEVMDEHNERNNLTSTVAESSRYQDNTSEPETQSQTDPVQNMPEASAESSTPSSPENTADWIEILLANPDPHYEEVFARYVAAKQELGEDTSRLEKDKFVQKLRKNAQQCMEQYEDCRGVLFDITIKEHKVIIKPQLIPKE